MGVDCGVCEEELVKQVALRGHTDSVTQPASSLCLSVEKIIPLAVESAQFVINGFICRMARSVLSLFAHTCTYHIMDTPAVTLNG